MCIHTLKMMDKGGIHDHISSGFARYSTDKKWHVPHFEKMLYDQGQLVMAYLDSFLCTKDQIFANVVRDIMTYVLRDLSHPVCFVIFVDIFQFIILKLVVGRSLE